MAILKRPRAWRCCALASLWPPVMKARASASSPARALALSKYFADSRNLVAAATAAVRRSSQAKRYLISSSEKSEGIEEGEDDRALSTS